MKPRAVIGVLLAALVVIAGLNYVRLALRRAALPPAPARLPALDAAPVRLHGLIEPLGREAQVGPLQPRRVVAVAAREGATVKAGDVLVRLDDDLERLALRVAESRLEEAVRRLDTSRDELRRKRELAQDKVIPEFEATQLELQTRLVEQQVATAQAEVELRRAELEKLVLRAPLDGVVYKLDVRLGEQLTPQDGARILVGRPEKQVRLFVETFWLRRLEPGRRYRVRETETLQEVGTGVIESIAPYVGTRDFRTEDRLERLDTKYAQAILRLDGPTAAPIGLQVVCERVDN